MDPTETRPIEADNRRHKSLTLAIRSQVKKRRSFVRPSSPPPSCEERVHYPVFNPEDPRHNPPNSPPWDQEEYMLAQIQSEAQPSNTRDSVRWMQSLPRKSLHKARSGFLALRSGMQRNPQTRSRARGNIPSIWSSSEDSSEMQDDDFPSTVSEASTEEDIDFGTGLYRTPCNCSSALIGEPERYLLRAHRSSVTLAGPGCLSHLDIECCSSYNDSSETLNSSDGDVDLEPQESSRGASSQLPRDILSKTSSFGCTLTSTSSDSSSSPDNAPRLGASQSTEPLQVFHQSTASSVSCDKSSRDESDPEPAQPTEPVNLIDRAYSRENVPDSAANNPPEDNTDAETNTDVMSRLSYRPDLLEALGSTHSSSRDSESSDSSAQQSMQSTSHSEGETETPPTSISNHIRSSTDTNTDADADLASLTSMRDEYLVEDKSNHPRHDGRDTIKREGQSIRRQERNSIPCDPRFDETSSARHPSVCEIPPPLAPPEIRISPAEDVGDPGEESDEYLVTYSMWQRHFG